jgi:hypothetical protein
MTMDTDRLVERILESDCHAFVLICEADKYLPMFDSLTIRLEGPVDPKTGQPDVVPVTRLNKGVELRVNQVRKTLGREDRVQWALRFFRKALILEHLWYVRHDPEWILKKTGKLPLPENEQTGLQRALLRLADVNLRPFRYDQGDLDMAEEGASEPEPPYTGFDVIDTLVASLLPAIKAYQDYGAEEADNPINKMIITPDKSYFKVLGAYRHGYMRLMEKYSGKFMPTEIPDHGPDEADLRDSEGPLKTILVCSNGYRWFDLLRLESELHGKQLMGHCGNTAGHKQGTTLYELDEPVTIKGKLHFIAHVTAQFDENRGTLHEIKGRKNNPPSSRFYKCLFELLLKRPEINGLVSTNLDFKPQNNFFLKYLNREQLATLAYKKPELWQNSTENELPDTPFEELRAAGAAAAAAIAHPAASAAATGGRPAPAPGLPAPPPSAARGPAIQGTVEPGQPA